MNKCPKCSSQYDDALKICRTCGAILERVAEEPPPTVEAALPPCEKEDAAEAAPIRREAWKCPQCGESVPAGFEVCWNCGTGQDGSPDPEFNQEPGGDEDDSEIWQPPKLEPIAEQAERSCPRCGSSKIIPDAKIIDQSHCPEGRLCIAVDGDPNAMIFKDRRYDPLNVDICGNCGHVELTTANPNDLYEHYLESISDKKE